MTPPTQPTPPINYAGALFDAFDRDGGASVARHDSTLTELGLPPQVVAFTRAFLQRAGELPSE